jgi:hypothetical protein
MRTPRSTNFVVSESRSPRSVRRPVRRARARNLSTTRSARGCHPCLRYGVLPVCPGRTIVSWSGRRDSNPRPRPWLGRALPLSYTRIREAGGDGSPATGRAMPNADRECNSRRVTFESALITGYRSEYGELPPNGTRTAATLPLPPVSVGTGGSGRPVCRATIRAISRTSPAACRSIRRGGSHRNRRWPTIQRTPDRHRSQA